MNILYFHQFFNTPDEGGSVRSYYLARYLVQKGHQVTIITSDTDGRRRSETIDGIQVEYLPVQFDNAYRFWKRLMAYMLYAIWASLFSIKYRKTDLCYVMTTPLSTGWIAWFSRNLLNRPYVVEVGDLWPLVPIEMGYFKSKWMQRLLYRFEKRFYRQAKGAVGLSPSITQYIQKVAPDTPVETIYNMSDVSFFEPSTKLAKRDFVITYAGNFGIANDLARMVDVAMKVQHLPIKFQFIGAGAEQQKVSDLAKGLDNCEFLGHMSKSEVRNHLSQSDAMLISFADYPSLSTGCPNKLFDALAAGLMVITNFEGWSKDLIEQEQVGFSFNHHKAGDFEQKIAAWLEDEECLKSAKSRSRQLAEQRFSVDIQAEKLYQFLGGVVER